MTSTAVFIIAGEASGDILGAQLVQSLSQKIPNLAWHGVGGSQMREAGVHTQYDIGDLAVVGFLEVVKNYFRIRKIFFDVLHAIQKIKPVLVLLIDYPGFNLRLAKKIRTLNIPVLYYVSPQIWAWAPGRIHFIKRYIQKMVVLFSFEKDLYQKIGMDVYWAGHPMIDHVVSHADIEQLKQEWHILEQHPLIAILPGSRKSEIMQNFPVMVQTATQLITIYPKIHFLVPYVAMNDEAQLQSMLPESLKKHFLFLYQGAYDIFKVSDFAMVASGSATLEAACMLLPMVIIYRVKWLTWLIARFLIQLPYIGLVNVVAGKKIIPELIQMEAKPKNIVRIVTDYLQNESKRQSMIQELKMVKEKLGPGQANERAAQYIAQYVRTLVSL